jgi:hypothetical protein
MIYDEDEGAFFCEWCHANPCICEDDANDGAEGWALSPRESKSLWDETIDGEEIEQP